MSTPDQVARDLVELAVATRARVHGIVVAHGAMLQAEVKRRANLPRSGPPGPRNQTGTYLRSINRLTTKRATETTTSVGTNAVQGRRLEFGFVGTDSLGRDYSQPAYPHFGPALDEVAPKFQAALAAAGLPAGRSEGIIRGAK